MQTLKPLDINEMESLQKLLKEYHIAQDYHIRLNNLLPLYKEYEYFQKMEQEYEEAEQTLHNFCRTHMAGTLVGDEMDASCEFYKESLQFQMPVYETIEMYDRRMTYIKRYGFTILSWSMIFQIAQRIGTMKTIEVGCGIGTITLHVNAVLEKMGYDNKVIASDIDTTSTNIYFDESTRAPIADGIEQDDAVSQIIKYTPEVMISISLL